MTVWPSPRPDAAAMVAAGAAEGARVVPVGVVRRPGEMPEAACRPDCGACCIAPSISSPMPGLPHGKPAGVPCPHLDERRRCRLFGDPRRPAVCGSLAPGPEMCGTSAAAALRYLADLEAATAPARVRTAPSST